MPARARWPKERASWRADGLGLHAHLYVLHIIAWALIIAVSCLDRGNALQAHHLATVPPHVASPWAAPLLAYKYQGGQVQGLE